MDICFIQKGFVFILKKFCFYFCWDLHATNVNVRVLLYFQQPTFQTFTQSSGYRCWWVVVVVVVVVVIVIVIVIVSNSNSAGGRRGTPPQLGRPGRANPKR